MRAIAAMHSEGQTVTAQDAKQIAIVLHAASVSDTLAVALFDGEFVID